MHAVLTVLAAAAIAAQPARPAADTPAAERTRTKLLKAKVDCDFKEVSLRDALKEFAHQVDTKLERPVMWTYADAKAGSLKITFRCNDKPLEEALDELFTPLKLGYFVISEGDHPRDGWVRITRGSERGVGSLTPAAPKPEDDEAKAAARLAAAKEKLGLGRTATAKAVLEGLIDKYPKTRAAAEAKTLLEKLNK